MPHFPHTPEALLRRNDSKDAARTCRGITASGRACRRALASSPLRLAGDQDGALSYCWQHQNQADQGNVQPETDMLAERRKKAAHPTLQERSSIDTLMQKLGINAVEVKQRQRQTQDPKQSKHRSSHNRASGTRSPQTAITEKETRRKRTGGGFWSALCCMSSTYRDDDDYVEIVRHRKRVQHMQETAPAPVARTAPHAIRNTQPQVTWIPDQPLIPNQSTQNLLSLIPTDIPAATTSALLAELAKPISPYDEDGYIYIFWLTPQSKERPGDSTARALLSTPEARPHNSRRISDVMTEYSYQEDNETSSPAEQRRNERGKRTIMLKIGRANNVTRRMNEWQRQCGYALSLVRWYPHIPSSSNTSPSPQTSGPTPQYPDLSAPTASRRQSETVHKCPHVHRVERLIHLELAAKRVKRQCGACAKEHREWFEVEATEAGVKSVDETIRRWMAWAERQG